MSEPRCRWLPPAVADGLGNMAADEVLLEAAAAGVASLRVYRWSEATVSLGYFQPDAARQADPRLAPLPFVRRATGGQTLVHHFELTYALALPAGEPWQAAGSPQPWLCRMHGVIAAALRDFGVPTAPVACADERHADSPLCFLHQTAGDLLLAGHKVVGSAQRRQRGALLQHGAVLLAASPHAPALPGVRELSGRQPRPAELGAALAAAWSRETGWPLVPDDWTPAERRRAEELGREKYARASWNQKR